MEKFTRWDNAKIRGKISFTTIILPEYFVEEVLDLVWKQEEYAGFLICSMQRMQNGGIGYNVECVYAIDKGTGGSVFPSKSITMTNGQHVAIEFHTHPMNLGRSWADKFSDGDLRTFQRRKEDNPLYKHVLFTIMGAMVYSSNEEFDFRIATTNDGVKEVLKEKVREWETAIGLPRHSIHA